MVTTNEVNDPSIARAISNIYDYPGIKKIRGYGCPQKIFIPVPVSQQGLFKKKKKKMQIGHESTIHNNIHLF